MFVRYVIYLVDLKLWVHEQEIQQVTAISEGLEGRGGSQAPCAHVAGQTASDYRSTIVFVILNYRLILVVIFAK